MDHNEKGATSAEALQDLKDKLKLQRANAKRKFTRKLNGLNERLSYGDPTEALKQKFEEVCSAYREVEKFHDELCALDLSIEENQDKTDDDYMMVIDGKLDDVRAEIAKCSLIGRVENSPGIIRVKKLDTPSFCGNIRDYPTFKQDYERLMKRDFGNDPYALKSCLSGEALEVVRGVEDDYEKMFTRLDDKYGQARKLADAIISELRKLKPIAEGDSKKFIQMVNVIERSWLDLKKMNLNAEMNNATMISQIEKLLPTTLKREWVLLNDNASGSSVEFSDILNFLLREKRALEYMESDIRCERSTSSKAAVYSSILEDKEKESDSGFVNLVQKIHDSQQSHQKQIQESITRMTEMVVNLLSTKSCEPSSMGSSSTPNAKRNNTLFKKCWFHLSDSHSIVDCTTFHSLDVPTKLDAVRKSGGCFCCLEIGHLAKYCRRKNPCDVLDSQREKCRKFHHPTLHRGQLNGNAYYNSMNKIDKYSKREGGLLMFSRVNCKGHMITALWDPGANMSFITHQAARRLGLRGTNIRLTITKVGNQTEWFDSKEYDVQITDTSGKIWEIKAYGMNEVTSDVDNIDVSRVVHLFKGIRVEDITRNSSKVELLIGTDCCILLPVVVQTVGNLQLMKNQFGYCLRGSHPLLGPPSTGIFQVKARIHHSAALVDVNNVILANTSNLKNSLQEFFEVENLGTYFTPKCGECKCGKCITGNGNYTLQEERELSLIKQGLKYDTDTREWTVSYPWIKDPYKLPNNIHAVIARLKSTEKRLDKLGSDYSKAYQDQIQDMLNRNVARKLSRQEIKHYEGPVHYIQHNEILKPESSSTPIRIVFNSSASYMGHVLNDYWAKGPTVVNNLLGVLLRFRQKPIAICGDISKMYNTVKLSTMDQHTHRFLWRNFQRRAEPDHFALTTVPFGDRPSGAIAILAMRYTAEMSKDEYPEAVDMIVRNSYVDDLLHSVSTPEEARIIATQVENILEYGSFHVKHWIVSGNHTDLPDINVLKSTEERVLGLVWQPKEDQFKYHAKVNFSPKYKKIRTGPNLTSSEIDGSLPEKLTKRMVLSQIATIYDPLGQLVPFTLTSKILMRELVMQNVDWDEPISEQMKLKWTGFFKELCSVEMLTFKRCIQPYNANGDPMMIVFADGSVLAYGACAYIRWRLKSGGFDTRLIAAKNRIAPRRQLTIPRLELCGAVMGCRLGEFIQREMDFKFEKIVYIVDSAIVRAQIQKESYGFGTFVAVKVAEIQNKTNPNDWWWVPTDKNPADLTTRPEHIAGMGPNSLWQKGPEYLRQPMESWPISQFCNEELPDKIGIMMTTDAQINSAGVLLDVIDVERYSSYSKLLRITSIILEVARNKSFKGAFRVPHENRIKNTEMEWIKYLQRNILNDWQTRYKRLGPSLKNGIIVVGQRMASWLKDNWNQDRYILLPHHHHPFVKLYIRHLHDIDHAGVEVTLAKLQKKFWVPGARKVIKLIKDKCIFCRKLEKKIVGQQMGQLADEQLRPSPPFHHTALDLFGPYQVKDMVRRRVKGKAYGVIFNCLASRAVHIDLAEGLDTESFLMTFKRFVALRGYPAKIHSDGGTQLIAANKELRQIASTWDWSRILEFGSFQGTSWTFNRAADAPWENGCSEAIIKLIKRLLSISIGETVLSFSELQTVFFEVANLLNERPIGIKPGFNPELGGYLCPNDLLLGRSSSHVPTGSWNNSASINKRIKFIQKVVDNFWTRWQRDYFSTLIVRNKWHHSKRNVQVGDIVLVQDSNTVRGTWKLAQVTAAKQGRDEKVRDVSLRYKIQKPSDQYTGQYDTIIQRSVHRLVILLPVEEQY